MTNDPTNHTITPASSDDFGKMRKASESFRTVPHDSESLGSLPNPSEANHTTASQRQISHTLTVREVARMFETAGVARTERRIVNWCQPNPQGVARLNAYYDLNERKWFITPESVNRAIADEQAKAVKNSAPFAGVEPVESTVPKPSEPHGSRDDEADDAVGDLKSLRHEIVDLKITNRVKDSVIEQLQKERVEFASERAGYVEKLMVSNRRVGELEATVHPLTAGQGERPAVTE